MHPTTTSPATATHPAHGSTSPLVPFGKFRGTPLSDVPDDYLLWLSMLNDLRRPLLTHVLAEMAKRMIEQNQQLAAVTRGGAR